MLQAKRSGATTATSRRSKSPPQPGRWQRRSAPHEDGFQSLPSFGREARLPFETGTGGFSPAGDLEPALASSSQLQSTLTGHQLIASSSGGPGLGAAMRQGGRLRASDSPSPPRAPGMSGGSGPSSRRTSPNATPRGSAAPRKGSPPRQSAGSASVPAAGVPRVASGRGGNIGRAMRGGGVPRAGAAIGPGDDADVPSSSSTAVAYPPSGAVTEMSEAKGAVVGSITERRTGDVSAEERQRRIALWGRQLVADLEEFRRAFLPDAPWWANADGGRSNGARSNGVACEAPESEWYERLGTAVNVLREVVLAASHAPLGVAAGMMDDQGPQPDGLEVPQRKLASNGKDTQSESRRLQQDLAYRRPVDAPEQSLGEAAAFFERPAWEPDDKRASSKLSESQYPDAGCGDMSVDDLLPPDKLASLLASAEEAYRSGGATPFSARAAHTVGAVRHIAAFHSATAKADEPAPSPIATARDEAPSSLAPPETARTTGALLEMLGSENGATVSSSGRSLTEGGYLGQEHVLSVEELQRSVAALAGENSRLRYRLAATAPTVIPPASEPLAASRSAVEPARVHEPVARSQSRVLSLHAEGGMSMTLDSAIPPSSAAARPAFGDHPSFILPMTQPLVSRTNGVTPPRGGRALPAEARPPASSRGAPAATSPASAVAGGGPLPLQGAIVAAAAAAGASAAAAAAMKQLPAGAPQPTVVRLQSGAACGSTADPRTTTSLDRAASTPVLTRGGGAHEGATPPWPRPRPALGQVAPAMPGGGSSQAVQVGYHLHAFGMHLSPSTAAMALAMPAPPVGVFAHAPQPAIPGLSGPRQTQPQPASRPLTPRSYTPPRPTAHLAPQTSLASALPPGGQLPSHLRKVLG
eukprot:TRINITY_DN27834_c0_g1_i3.p1 TRINITY_DN27834_c0_g1~~TRINITY_DN27834_c0_g1_i3.p1  ORF type:complete len:870 (+),score=100.36 TRINITY_DN27834_c0_g1_i3:93-2702(+)